MRGVNQFIAASMLILIAMVIGIIVANFVSTLSQERTKQIQTTVQQRLECQFANMYIETVSYDCNNNCAQGISHLLNVTVVNSGSRALGLNNVHIQNTTLGLYSYDIGNITINASEIYTVEKYSTDSCDGIRNVIDKVRMVSTNCPDTAFDAYPGSLVTYLNC